MSEIQRWLYQGMAGGMKEAGGLDGILALLGLAFLFGAIHASMPGHGKSVLVSYHLSRPGRPANGIFNGIFNGFLLVLTHVGSAIVLVLVGMAIIRTTIGPSRQTQTLEIASSVLVLTIGLWLLWRSLRPHRDHRGSGPVLAVVTGLVPCPLTTFVMTYSVMNGILALGLIVVTAMAFGMVVTIGGVAALSVIAGARLAGMAQRSERWRARVGKAIEIAGAVGIVAIGVAGLAL